MLKINVVLELAFRQQFDIRPGGNEQILFQAGIWLVKFFGKSQDEIDGMPKDDEDEE